MDSRLPGFYKLPLKERLEKITELCDLTEEQKKTLGNTGALEEEIADRLIENVVGTLETPLGIATNFKINDKDYLIPMATEETSVIAAASNGAKISRKGGGIKTESTEPLMIGQIQLLGINDPHNKKIDILRKKEEIFKLANKQDRTLVKFGGGARDIEVRIIDTPRGQNLVVHLIVDCRDAMGANAVNSMAEAVAIYLEEITGGESCLRIITNLADKRLSRAKAVFPKEEIGEKTVESIIDAYTLAAHDPYRASTHNKGIMNGITAVTLATGNDTRAIESGAHTYASIGGYTPLTTYEKNENGDLVGTIELPTAVGTVGGSTSVHPTAKLCTEIIGAETANELGEILAAVGLIQNFSALKALSTEGIQRGHMSLHAKNIAMMAGARGKEIDKVGKKLAKSGEITSDNAKKILKEIRN
ncbi:Hydroxymethylglutaryl-CoA reductase HMG1 [Methanonatronarchaeum thermophilum]|uniref:3-hydroxy-3-methylglutaryl coenzyme A reductase n=2 Tax=Methanonatronarchaeum thermophilum TaxID=1927129 RepID=A0A1Y3GDA9_9EURY|nr:hydroxymethylglutaryl-CoA reductase, degradative [Methanonatronarchaeum thermophilum]OUJ19428.1 Hydroxymethylglutaryl-CoA reductase HMG1 [Methanonatronarchaeum thermophilum]